MASRTLAWPPEKTENREASAGAKTPPSQGGRSRGQARKPRQHWGNAQKKSQPMRVGILGIGGGVEPRTKRLLKVRNRSAAGCCEPVRTPSKSLPDCRPASRFYSHAGRRERASNPSAIGCQFNSKSGIEPASAWSFRRWVQWLCHFQLRDR